MFSTFSGFSVLCPPCKWNPRLQQFGLNSYERTIDSRGPYPEVVPWKMPSGFFRKSAFLPMFEFIIARNRCMYRTSLAELFEHFLV
jgi:hypothetical protein